MSVDSGEFFLLYLNNFLINFIFKKMYIFKNIKYNDKFCREPKLRILYIDLKFSKD